ncbi:MAG: DUF2157 domain-containing protein [Verrucomicrobiae bacterium]|nr:DUF2157 domain-containing protein [Verrucomicrobiae bacterium]
MNSPTPNGSPSFDQEYNKTPKVVRRHVAAWLKEGLMDESLARKLLDYSAEHLAGGERNLAGFLLGSIAGLFVLTGIILLIAEHWQGIPDGVKLVSALFLMAGFQYAGWRLREHPDAAWRWLSEGFLVIGGGMILGTIALVSQIYNLDSRPPNGVLLWLLLLAPLPWLTRSTSLWVLKVVVLATWLGMEFYTEDSLLHSQHDQGAVMLWIGIGMLLWALAELPRLPFHSIGQGIIRFCGMAIFLGTSLILSFCIQHREYDKPDFDHPCAVGTFIALCLASWGASRWTTQQGFRSYSVLDATLAILCLVSLTAIGFNFWFLGLLLWAIHLVICLILIREGAEQKNTSWINMGILFILISVMARYFDFFNDYLSGGLFFIATGLLFFALIWFLEKQRRRWTAAARSAHNPNL